MTEKDWFKSGDAYRMYRTLNRADAWTSKDLPDGYEVSCRKLRLFAVASLRSVWPYLEEVSRRAVTVAEMYAEGYVADKDFLNDARLAAHIHAESLSFMTPGLRRDVIAAARAAAQVCQPQGSFAALGVFNAGWSAGQVPLFAEIMREVMGNPWKPWCVCGSRQKHYPHYCLTRIRVLSAPIMGIARGIADDKAFDRMPVLADALEESGCPYQDLLNHLRGPGTHYAGCWALDLVLGKS